MNKLVRLNKIENARIHRMRRLCLEYFSVNSIWFFLHGIHEFTRRYPAVLSYLKNSAGAGPAKA